MSDPQREELTVQICQPRTASQSWNTDNWCWVDWVGTGMAACLAVMVVLLLGLGVSILWRG